MRITMMTTLSGPTRETPGSARRLIGLGRNRVALRWRTGGRSGSSHYRVSSGIPVLLIMLVCAIGCVLLAASGRNQPIQAAETTNHAGVVVRDADGVLTYAYVAFAEPSLDGVELLRRTGIPLISAGFGGLGEAICSLDGEGCSLAECRRNLCQANPDAPFWQYFRQTAPGAWHTMPLGPSAATIADGAIDGWSWTNGAAGLPALSLPELARRAGSVDGQSATRRAGLERTVSPVTQPELYVAAVAVLLIIGAGAIVGARRHGDRTGGE